MTRSRLRVCRCRISHVHIGFDWCLLAAKDGIFFCSTMNDLEATEKILGAIRIPNNPNGQLEIIKETRLYPLPQCETFSGETSDAIYHGIDCTKLSLQDVVEENTKSDFEKIGTALTH